MNKKCEYFEIFNLAPSSFDCDFENSFCGWVQESGDEFTWERATGMSSQSPWRPKVDTTKNDPSMHFFTNVSKKGKSYKLFCRRYIFGNRFTSTQSEQKIRPSSLAHIGKIAIVDLLPSLLVVYERRRCWQSECSLDSWL